MFPVLPARRSKATCKIVGRRAVQPCASKNPVIRGPQNWSHRLRCTKHHKYSDYTWLKFEPTRVHWGIKSWLLDYFSRVPYLEICAEYLILTMFHHDPAPDDSGRRPAWTLSQKKGVDCWHWMRNIHNWWLCLGWCFILLVGHLRLVWGVYRAYVQHILRTFINVWMVG